MQEMGDDRIDLLKLDIEGGEYDLLPQLDLQGLQVKVFAVTTPAPCQTHASSYDSWRRTAMSRWPADRRSRSRSCAAISQLRRVSALAQLAEDRQPATLTPVGRRDEASRIAGSGERTS